MESDGIESGRVEPGDADESPGLCVHHAVNQQWYDWRGIIWRRDILHCQLLRVLLARGRDGSCEKRAVLGKQQGHEDSERLHDNLRPVGVVLVNMLLVHESG